MDDLKKRFYSQADRVRFLCTQPNDEELLQLYAHYKQATLGNNTAAQPWVLQVRERRKWMAWNSLEGMPVPEAANRYIALVDSLIAKYGDCIED